MIRSFADRHTKMLFETGASPRFPKEITARASRQLRSLNSVRSVHELAEPRSNRLHLLAGDRAGQYSISVNMKWRICFRFIAGDAVDVELCDYH